MPSKSFPGNQQFFFRFIVLLDNYRFCQCLESCLTSEIILISDAINDKNDSKTSTYSSFAGYAQSGGGVIISKRSENDDNITNSSSNRSNNSPIIDSTSQSGITNSDSFSLKVLKLKLLGKFLGLIHFWPNWNLTIGLNSKDNSPITLLSNEIARNRSLMRSTLPIKKIIEKSWTSGRLYLTVPWIVEFMKMIIYDPSWRIEHPYEDVLGILKSIQRSDLFHIKYGNISSNRLYIIIEIQNLWDVLISYTVNRSSGNLPKLPKSNLSTNVNGQKQMIDDENSSFSPSFLKHVVPYLDELLKLMKKKKNDNISNINSPLTRSLSINSSNSTTNLRPKRQTPTIITNSNIVGSNISNNSSLSQFNPSTATFTSVAATSVNNSFISAANGSQFRPYSPTQVSSVSKQRSLSKYSSGGKNFPSSPISSPASLQRSFSSPQSNIGSVALNTSSSSLDYLNNIVPVSERLITSFWQQHPQLLQISTFILEHLRHSCLAHLRERVGDSIRELWNRVANIKVEIEEDIFINNSLLSQTNKKETDLLVKFQSLLCTEVKHMHTKTLNDGKIFLEEFTSKNLNAIIPELCTLYPCHIRVSNLAIYLIKMQGKFQCTPLLNFLSSYSQRKLDEVYNISVKQYQKIVDGKSLTLSTINKELLVINNDNMKNKISYSKQLQSGIISPKIEDNNAKFSKNKEKIIEKITNLIQHIISRYPTSILNLNESYNNINKLIDKFMSENKDMELFLKEFIQMSVNHLKDKIVPKFKFRNYILILFESIQELLLIISSCSNYIYDNGDSNDNINEITYVNFLIITMKNSLICLEVLFVWLRTNVLIDEFHYFDAIDPDMKGKIVIDIVKFFTLSLPSLLYLDAFVKKSIIVDNKLILDNLYYPSDCILKVTSNSLISSNSFIRLLISTCRTTTVSYYESCKGLVGFKLLIKQRSLDLIARYLSLRTDLGLVINSFTTASLNICIGDNEESWYRDPSTRYTIKTLFGSELSSLITQLAKD